MIFPSLAEMMSVVLFDLVFIGWLTRHVPHFSLFLHTSRQSSSSSRSVAIVVARIKVGDVLELFLQGKVIEGLTEGELPVDFGLRDVKVGDVEEALGPDGIYKNTSELSVTLLSAVLREVDVCHF